MISVSENVCECLQQGDSLLSLAGPSCCPMILCNLHFSRGKSVAHTVEALQTVKSGQV